jgi:hypothetical protein
MSDHGDGGGNAHPVLNKDFGVRPSAGVSWMVLTFMAVTLVIIFWQGGNVVGSAKSGHVWPAGDSTKIQLPPSKT